MKDQINNEFSILRILLPSLFIVTVLNIFTKLISGYNAAIAAQYSDLEKIANHSPRFGFYDSFNFFNHSAFFTFFALFIFLTSLAFDRWNKTHFYSKISLLIFVLSFLQATFFSLCFSEIVEIEWNIEFVLPNIFDQTLFIFFTLTIFLQIKIIYDFVIERFHAKISLK